MKEHTDEMELDLDETDFDYDSYYNEYLDDSMGREDDCECCGESYCSDCGFIPCFGHSCELGDY